MYLTSITYDSLRHLPSLNFYTVWATTAPSHHPPHSIDLPEDDGNVFNSSPLDEQMLNCVKDKMFEGVSAKTRCLRGYVPDV